MKELLSIVRYYVADFSKINIRNIKTQTLCAAKAIRTAKMSSRFSIILRNLKPVYKNIIKMEQIFIIGYV